MKGKREFYGTQVGAQMSTRFGNCSNNKFADLGSQLLELRSRQTS
jgi:hypothetical protein